MTSLEVVSDLSLLYTGVAPASNRTAWPTTGGALALIPIHAFDLMTVNIALGNNIDESQDSNPYNVPMVPLFNQTGANSTFCIPKIKIPKKIADQVHAGVNATIQVVMLTATNAALYSVCEPGLIFFFGNRGGRRVIIRLYANGRGRCWEQCIDLTFSDTEADRFGDPAVWNKFCYNGTGMGGHALGPSSPLNGTQTAGMGLLPLPQSSLLVTGVVSLLLWMI